jgi:hypothetical protein
VAKKQTAESIGAVPRGGGKPATKRIVQSGGKAKLDKRGHLQVDNPNPSGE